MEKMLVEAFLLTTDENYKENEKGGLIYYYPDDLPIDTALLRSGSFVALYQATNAIVENENDCRDVNITTSDGVCHVKCHSKKNLILICYAYFATNESEFKTQTRNNKEIIRQVLAEDPFQFKDNSMSEEKENTCKKVANYVSADLQLGFDLLMPEIESQTIIEKYFKYFQVNDMKAITLHHNRIVSNVFEKFECLLADFISCQWLVHANHKVFASKDSIEKGGKSENHLANVLQHYFAYYLAFQTYFGSHCLLILIRSRMLVSLARKRVILK